MSNQFTWIPFYKELAVKLLDWETRQSEIIEFLEKLREKGLTITPLNDKDDQGNFIPLKEIDPFTFFGVFNRKIKKTNRISILTEIKQKFNVQAPLPIEFKGIPVINNQRSWFFSYLFRRKKNDIEKLWEVFKLALKFDSIDTNYFKKVFNEAQQVWGVNVNLTMGLYWINPDKFLNLDSTNRAYLNIEIPAKGINSDFYFKILKDVSKKYQSFPELSNEAYLEVVKKRSIKPKKITQDNTSYWLVGAYWDGDDQVQRFLDEGIWQNGYEDKLLDKVNSMKPGDKIAIKAAATQKFNLPFDSQGRTVSKNIIKARGTIVSNRGDGRNIEVEWDSDFDQKDWYFYTGRDTIWKIILDKDYWGYKYSKKLVDFIWNDIPQDYDWFLKQWYEEETEEDINKNLYGIDDIIQSDVFLDEDEIRRIINILQTKKNIILQGSPGTGKTFFAHKLAYALIEQKNNDYIEMIQFHQSFSYEDFVRGFRPLPNDGSKFVLKDSIFFKFCKKAEADPHNQYVFIIDEINRGNISQIFGELLMLIEADKRKEGYAIPLMYNKKDDERFYIPPNLYLIGLMNIADRSLALVDYALRRRFAFITLEPKYSSEKYFRWLRDHNMKQDIIDLINLKMNKLNIEIKSDSSLGENFQIGHSYFCPKKEDFSQLDKKWYLDIIVTEIIPLIKEYWFDNKDKVSEIEKMLTTI